MVPNTPGMHDIDDWERAITIPGLVIYRYDAPLCFANAENFKSRALQAITNEKTIVEWFVLNTEAIVEIDITAMDVLEEFYDELAARGIIFAFVRIKQDLYTQLKRSQLLKKMNHEHIFLTLHSMIASFESRPTPSELDKQL
jgi:sulfate permease, SulP family